MRRRLLVRLLSASVLIAVCSVTGTAWLVVETTTRALQEEQGRALADDMDILARISGYAASHPDWQEAEPMVSSLAQKTGRRIALTTADRSVIADSAPPGTPRPPTPAATIDPLHTDTYSEPGAQREGLDPRVVGPYMLSTEERARLDGLARARRDCFARHGVDTVIVRAPTGRPVLTDDAGNVDGGNVPLECADGKLNTLTATESKAQADLLKRTRDCLQAQGLRPNAYYLDGVDITVRGLHAAGDGAGRPEAGSSAHKAAECADDALRSQLDPYVAPVADLFLGVGASSDVRFDMSRTNKAKVAGVVALVLSVTVAVTAAAAARLVRPLRALTEAVRQPLDRHVRVPVTRQDETGILADAINDLTERRVRLEAQRKAMVSDIAHELRTPLTNIRGWLEIVRDGVVDPDRELLTALHEEALVLQRVVDDLRDLSEADAGTLRLHYESVLAADLLEQVAAAHRLAAESAGVVLRTAVESRGMSLDADPVRMRQALGNIVSNALRHTPPGGTVTLMARPDGNTAVFEVVDTGSGIPPQDLPHVFQRFWRAEKSRSRRTGGSGLGLPIVRHLLTAHGGTVDVASKLGVGTVFTLRLPSSAPPRPLEEHED
ncbi:Sensor histidine kinase RcsC [Streptomyces sp. enrichment culture]